MLSFHVVNWMYTCIWHTDDEQVFRSDLLNDRYSTAAQINSVVSA